MGENLETPPRGLDAPHGRVHALEAIGDDGDELARFIEGPQASAIALEQSAPEPVLEQCDLPAHRAMRHAELLGRIGDAVEPHNGFERLQHFQRKRLARHIRLSLSLPQ